QYIHLYLTTNTHFGDISFYRKDDRVMTVMEKAVCFQQDSRLLVKSSLCLPDAARTPYPTYK
ncbi:TPA: hypothetical protein ACULAH_004353, partial [Escherichia coli]